MDLNKKYFTKNIQTIVLIALMIIASLFFVNSYTNSKTINNQLKSSRIRELRQEYSYMPLEASLAYSVEPTLEEQIRNADTFVYGEILSNRYKYDEVIVLENSQEISFVGYHLKVIDDTSGLFSEDEYIIVESNSLFEETIPEFNIGDEVVIPLYDWKTESKQNRYSIGSTGMYYITETGHALSVYQDESAEVYNGWHISNLIGDLVYE